MITVMPPEGHDERDVADAGVMVAGALA